MLLTWLGPRQTWCVHMVGGRACSGTCQVQLENLVQQFSDPKVRGAFNLVMACLCWYITNAHGLKQWNATLNLNMLGM